MPNSASVQVRQEFDLAVLANNCLLEYTNNS